MAKYAHIKGHFIERLTDVIRVVNPHEHFITHDAPVGRFRVDSRAIRPGDIFVATPGARTDGHMYVDQVLEAGAGAALVSSFDKIKNRDRCILVDDPLESMRILAAHHRRSLDVRIIGITGSVGKTTTKEMLGTIMGNHAPTRKSEGNFNNTIGLPMEILKLRKDERWMVAEMGMSTPGEMAILADMTDPDIALFMCVKSVHQANFDSLEDIARAKAELVNGMRPTATLVYNADDPMVVRYSENHPGPKITYGMHSAHSDISARIEPFPGWDGTTFFLTGKDGVEHELYLPMVGKFNVYNAVAACTTALAAGVPASELRSSLTHSGSARGRCCLHHLRNDVRLVDDTYNSNPHAVDQVLRSFAVLSPGNYRWLVLGDMLELGPEENQIHHKMGKLLATYGFDRITLVGPMSAHAHRALVDAKIPNTFIEHFDTTDAAISHIDTRVPRSARIWLKASRGIRLEKLAQHLKDRLSIRPKG